MEDFINRIIQNDAISGLETLPDNSINCCVTSPPYWGLRDYGMSDQIGLEATPEEFIAKLVAVFREVKRVLRDDGTLWVNIGDSYCSTAPGTMGDPLHIKEASDEVRKSRQKYRQETPTGMKPKDLVGIPWMLAFALRADGWYLRQDIIWSKTACMPESVKDRCTKSHEYIFLLSKQPKYYFDHAAIMEPVAASTAADKRFQKGAFTENRPNRSFTGSASKGSGMLKPGDTESSLRSKRSVWSTAPAQLKEAHFATFPEDLIVPCIKAGCPIDGIVLDPFMGAGTTALVAYYHGRNFFGIELNPDYIKIAQKRLRPHVSCQRLFAR